jgi:hypothetical protein
MGAPGNALVCQKGHLFFWSDDDPYDVALAGAYEKACTAGCPCGEQRVIDLCHYGTITDCLGPDDGVITQIGVEKISTSQIEPIPDAVDRSGKPIQAFRKVEAILKKYDISGLHIPFKVHVKVRSGVPCEQDLALVQK